MKDRHSVGGDKKSTFPKKKKKSSGNLMAPPGSGRQEWWLIAHVDDRPRAEGSGTTKLESTAQKALPTSTS